LNSYQIVHTALKCKNFGLTTLQFSCTANIPKKSASNAREKKVGKAAWLAYKYLSHQTLSPKEEVAKVPESDRTLYKSTGDEETISATDCTPGDCGC